MRRLAFLLVAVYFATAATPAGAAGLAWEQWKKIPGVLDVDGPRSDGSLIVAGSGALYLVDPQGTVTDFARGPGGYHEDPGAEAYLAMSTGGTVSAAECSFVRDETFLLRLHVPIGVNRVNASGDESGPFANLTGVATLNGITFDSAGAFDHRLLVTGSQPNGKTAIFAIDCNGAVQVITRSAPSLGGGIAVAPSGFGSFGGALIAPDQLSGRVYAITSNGVVTSVARPSLRRGAEIGVESVGFVPPGFIERGGAAYYADRATARSSHPGTDSLLRLTSAQLGGAGVQDGDMLLATEGGAALDAVHCAASCTVTPLIAASSRAHGEGHIGFSVGAAAPSPTPAAPPSVAPGPAVPPQLVVLIGEWGIPSIATLALLVLLGLVGVEAVRRRKH